jgi:hypothetical protein
MTKEELGRFVSYDPESGHIRNVKTGKLLGLKPPRPGARYVSVAINGRQYLAHRVAFILMGVPLSEHVDHINHDGFDNRWVNLRTVPRKINLRNARISHRNKIGCLGISSDKKGYWRAHILGKSLYSGKDLFEAVCRRRASELANGYFQH